MDTMKAFVKTEPGVGGEIREVPIPHPGPGEVLLKVRATSICGSDLHLYFWDEFAAQRVRTPLVIGHEVTGEVVELGPNVEGVHIGDVVSVETHIACGHCYQCRTGNAHICENLKILGFDVPGAFAEYVVVPAANVWKVSRDLPPEVATILEPFGNAVYATLVEDVTGKSVAVFGGGPIGLMSVAVAKASGASKVFLIEPSEMRRQLGKTMGADQVIHPFEQDPVASILEETEGRGVDVLLEMSGAEPALIQGLQALRSGGRVSLLGLFPGQVTIDLNELIILRGVTVYGITGRRMFETWYKVSELVESGRVDLRPLITHRLPLEDAARGMELLKNKEAVKVVLYPQGVPDSK